MSQAVLNDPRRKPVDRQAAKILRKYGKPLETGWTKADEEKIRWAGLISKCPKCGDRAYQGGFCFGCGKPMARGTWFNDDALNP